MMASKVSFDNLSGPSIQIRMVCSCVFSPILLRRQVLMSFMLLKLRSTVTVTKYNTVACIYMLSDVLHTVAKLQGSLQGKQVDLPSVPGMVEGPSSD